MTQNPRSTQPVQLLSSTRDCTLEDRKNAIEIIAAFQSTVRRTGPDGDGRNRHWPPEHKIEKLRTLGELSPGVEFLETR